MIRIGRLRTPVVVIVSVAVLAVIVSWQLISYGRYCIQRGAEWKGVSLRHDGLALVYLCAQESGIRHAYFFLWPFKRVTLEKINSWESP
jgi:hypothetical protein